MMRVFHVLRGRPLWADGPSRCIICSVMAFGIGRFFANACRRRGRNRARPLSYRLNPMTDDVSERPFPNGLRGTAVICRRLDGALFSNSPRSNDRKHALSVKNSRVEPPKIDVNGRVDVTDGRSARTVMIYNRPKNDL